MSTHTSASVGYIGPPGSWTHQACLDLFNDQPLVPLSREDLFERYSKGEIACICVPVATSVVGVTPYLDDVLALPVLTVVAEYPKMLGYSLLVRPGTRREDITDVFAHPVALEEVKPWLDREMPHVRRIQASSGGAAAQTVANSAGLDKASLGPMVGSSLYSLVSLEDGIEEGPHNVTRWWVLGRDVPAPSGHDKTSLLVDTSDDQFGAVLALLANARVQILTIYERPSKQTLDTHRYLIEVAGHAEDDHLAALLAQHAVFRVLGSYPRK
ncbi:prephenate dehydratase [Pigmentiphaga aceris]|nr:prephenate dehydratase domain-containing protein [Pigmentiphaga aceris]